MYTNGTANSDSAINKFSVEPYPEERPSSLQWNIAAGILHIIQSIMQLVLALTIDNFKNFRLPIQAYFLGYFPDGENPYLVSKYPFIHHILITNIISTGHNI